MRDSKFIGELSDEELDLFYKEIQNEKTTRIMKAMGIKSREKMERIFRTGRVKCGVCLHGKEIGTRYPDKNYLKLGKIYQCTKPIMREKRIDFPFRWRKCKYFKHKGVV